MKSLLRPTSKPRRGLMSSAPVGIAFALVLFSIQLGAAAEAPRRDMALWYRQPAQQWLEALPIGNGLTGAMVFGGVQEQRIALNESSFWSGRHDYNDNNAGPYFPKIRDLVFAGQFQEAEKFADEHFFCVPTKFDNANDRLAADTYDADGNTQTASGTTTVDDYDALNRLVNRWSGSTSVAAIDYDHSGNRVIKTTSSPTNWYLVDDLSLSGYPQVLAEYQSLANTTPTVTYAYGNALIEQLRGSTLRYYVADGQMSVRLLLDTSATVTDTYDYDAYGILVDHGSNPTSNNYLYTGQQWDPDLGLYYLRARYYALGYGRFWTMDSSEGTQVDSSNLHKCLYASANPINRTDLSGHDDFDLGSLLTGIGTQLTVAGN